MSDHRRAPSPPRGSAPQRGLSLIELLVGMTIGLLIVAMLGYLYTTSRQSYRQQDNLARMQENGRLALDMISQDIRSAGYWGCVGRRIAQPVNSLNNAADYTYRYNVLVEGHEATAADTWVPARDASVAQVLSGTDILTVRGGFGNGATVSQHTAAAPAGSGSPKVPAGSDFAAGDILLISDCVNAAIFQVTSTNNVGGGLNLAHATGAVAGIVPGNAAAGLGKEYVGGEVVQAASKTYYVRLNDANRPSLYRLLNGVAEELVENVESLQVTYGVDTNGDRAVDAYQTANNVGNWNQVSVIRVQLLLVSPDTGAVNQPQAYVFNGATVSPNGALVAGTLGDPDDTRLRLVFSTSVGMRNRLP